MTDIKNQVQNIDPNSKARNIHEFIEDSNNIYEALAVITKRAKQLSVDIKQELHAKLDEFAITSETIEEIQENKEQIEISKFYEKLPNPTIIATEEFLEGKLEYRDRNSSVEEEEEQED